MSNYIFTIYSLLFLSSSLVSFFVAYLAWQRKGERGAFELALLMLSAGMWAFFVIFETAAPTIELKILWSKIAYTGALTSPLFYFLFVMRFVGKDKYLTKKWVFALSLVPLVVFILTISNEYHHLIWIGYAPICEKTNLTQYFHGIGFWLGNLTYSYLLLFFSSLYLYRFVIIQISAFKRQARIIFMASLCPWIASFFYVADINLVPGFDLVPLSMIFSGTLMAIGIFNNRFLDLAPVARETLLETLKDGILVLDRNNRIQDINKAAREFLGLTDKDIIGYDFKKFNSKAVSLTKEILSDSSQQMVEVLSHDTRSYYMIIKQDIKNYPGSRLIIIRDESDEVKREKAMLVATQKAEESDRLKSSFLANLSHEIRTPINVITGFIDIIQGNDSDSKDREIYVELLKKSSDRILNTLNDIIEISKIEAGQAFLEESQINLNEIMDYLYNSYIKTAQEKGVDFRYIKGSESKAALINADRLKLISVMSNLIKNGLKFTDSGVVEFGYNLSKGMINFYVKDNGIGIPKERQKLIFNRFVQAEQSINRPYEGSGLGLSIVKAYVGMMGGKIKVESNPGEGSLFSFSIKYSPISFGSV